MINNLRYADDTVILAETEHELQQLIDIVVQYSGVNRKVYSSTEPNPTPWCLANHHPYQHVRFRVHCISLEQMNSFVYLGSVFTSEGRCENEVKRRIGIAKTAFTSMKKVVLRKKHQYGGSTQSTEMLCLVNFAIRKWREQNTCSRKNVENTLNIQGQRM